MSATVGVGVVAVEVGVEPSAGMGVVVLGVELSAEMGVVAVGVELAAGTGGVPLEAVVPPPPQAPIMTATISNTSAWGDMRTLPFVDGRCRSCQGSSTRNTCTR